MPIRVPLTILVAALLTTTVSAQDAKQGSEREARQGGSKVTLVFDHVLPNVPGKSLRGVLVEYGPSGATPAHSHPASAFISATVLDGAIVSNVNDGPETVYRAGQNFSENPGDRHKVSRNASDSEPAKLFAVFVLDTGETTLVTPE